MSTTLEFIAGHLPDVTVADLQHRFTTIDIRDAEAFAVELQDFVRESVGEATRALPASLVLPAPRKRAGSTAPVDEELARKAAALHASTPWVPSGTEIQRGRAILLDVFRQLHNLPLQRFAELAGKSRQQIYKDIEARRLLALNIGPRKQKLPDWQLDQKKQSLTQAVLQGAPDVDNWTVYQVLSEPLEALDGRSPVDAVETDQLERVAETVFNVLGVVEAAAL